MSKKFNPDAGNTLTTSLVYYFQEEADSTAYYGSATGIDTTVTYSAGKVNNGGVFNGTTSKSLFIIKLVDTVPFSVAMWVKTPSAFPGGGAEQPFIETGDRNNKGWLFEFGAGGNSGKIGFFAVNSNALFSGALSTSTWYFVVGRLDAAGNHDIWINNVQAGSATGISYIAALTTSAFGTDTAFSTFAQCSLDEIGIWNKALSTQEMTDLYNAGNGQTMVDTPDVNLMDKMMLVM